MILFSKLKGFHLSDRNRKIFSKEFIDINILIEDFTKYISKEKCQPHDSSCYPIN